MEPSLISVMASGGLTRLLFSLSTSTMRSMDSMDMVIITNTIETVIRLIRIWKL